MLLCWSACVLLAQCASGPDLERHVTLTPADRVAVVFSQPRRNFKQSLLGAGLVDATAFYSSRDSDPLAKVLSNDGMQLLLDGLATTGFFEHARQHIGGGQPDVPHALSSIHVGINDAAWTWANHPGMDPDEAGRYGQCLATFQNVYNSTSAFHSAGDTRTLLDEHRRLRARWEQAQAEQGAKR